MTKFSINISTKIDSKFVEVAAYKMQDVMELYEFDINNSQCKASQYRRLCAETFIATEAFVFE